MNEEQFKIYLESQAHWRREEATRQENEQHLTDLITNTIKTDGMNLSELRMWMTSVKSNAEMIKNNASILKLMLRTTLGSLKMEIDRYILQFLQQHQDQHHLNTPWKEVFAHIRKQFLPNNDQDSVREAFENFKQASGESLRVYNRKFRDASEIAYPPKDRTQDQNRLIIKTYIKGLYHVDTARTVLRASPATLEDAIATAADSTDVEDVLYRMGHRQEEPMDVSATTQTRPAPSPMTAMAQQIERIVARISALEHTNSPRRMQPSRNPRRNPSWTSDGRPICHNCKQVGHYARLCNRVGGTTHNQPLKVSPVQPPQAQDQENF